MLKLYYDSDKRYRATGDNCTVDICQNSREGWTIIIRDEGERELLLDIKGPWHMNHHISVEEKDEAIAKMNKERREGI